MEIIIDIFTYVVLGLGLIINLIVGGAILILSAFMVFSLIYGVIYSSRLMMRILAKERENENKSNLNYIEQLKEPVLILAFCIVILFVIVKSVID